MKDKRQRMAMTWPYGIPPDPHLYAYIAAAASSFPYSLSVHSQPQTSALHPAVGSTPLSHFQSLSALQARADLMTTRSELMSCPDLLMSRPDLLTSRPDLFMSRSDILANRPELLSSLNGRTAFHKPLLDVQPGFVPSHFPYPFGFSLSPLSSVATLHELSASRGGIHIGGKIPQFSNFTGLHPLAMHFASNATSSTSTLTSKPEVKLS